MDRIYAIGDIHGCIDKLKELTEKIDIDFEHDLLIFIGDYIDRGPSSYEVVEYLINLKKEHPNIIFLRGNHEDMLMQFLSGADRYTYLINGGQKTLESYLEIVTSSDIDPIPHDHFNFFNSLLNYYETDDYIFVHAGLMPGIPLESQKMDDLLWIRDKFIFSDYDFDKKVIFGHTPFLSPMVQPNKIGIDTGAVYGRTLTCVRLPDLKFFHA